MPRDILSEYGPEYDAPDHSPGHSGVTTDGGKPYCKPVMNYQPPTGPINRHFQRPGLPGGTNLGNQNGPSGHDPLGGNPGLGGQNHGNKGSQGRH
jgi:hypothetical protein